MKHTFKLAPLVLVLSSLSLGVAHAQSTVTGDVNAEGSIEAGGMFNMAAAQNSVAEQKLNTISNSTVTGDANLSLNIEEGGVFNMAAAQDKHD